MVFHLILQLNSFAVNVSFLLHLFLSDPMSISLSNGHALNAIYSISSFSWKFNFFFFFLLFSPS